MLMWLKNRMVMTLNVLDNTLQGIFLLLVTDYQRVSEAVPGMGTASEHYITEI